MPTLPSITVTDPQYTKLAEVFGNEAGYSSWLKAALVSKIREFEEDNVRLLYTQAIQNLNAQEAQAKQAIETLLANLINGV